MSRRRRKAKRARERRIDGSPEEPPGTPSSAPPPIDAPQPTRRKASARLFRLSAGLALAIGLLGWLLASHLLTRVAEELSPRPWNVLLVTADTLRADKLGAYGNRTVGTPVLDRLAEEGILFTTAATVAPTTLPAHASIFTGTYPVYHGVQANGGQALSGEAVTLAEVLKSEGFATGAFVGAFVLDARWGLDQGFDTYADDMASAAEQMGNAAVSRPGGEVLKEALTWMDSVRDRRFFSWIHFFDPHAPYDPPGEFRARYARAGDPFALYDGEVAYVDRLMGELLDWLEERELTGSTLVVFIGDHGESLGEHRELTHGFFVYDATMRVPFLLKAPGLRPRRVEKQVRSIDLLPTVLDFLGLTPPPAVQGVSLMTLARGEVEDLALVAYGESELPSHYGWSRLESLRTDELHFIQAPRPELYAPRRDAGEVRDLAAARSRKLHGLEAELVAVRESYRSDEGREAAPRTAFSDAATEAKLRALGYLGGVSTRDAPSTGLADPKDKILLFNRIREAAAHEDAGRWDAAVREIETVLREDPKILEAYHMLGRFESARGRPMQSVAAYEKALGLQPDYRPVLFRLAMTQRGMGRLGAAVAGFQRLLELDPGSTEAAFPLSEIYLDSGNFSAAKKLLAAVRPSPAERPNFHKLMAACHFGLKELEAALDQAERALAIDPRLEDGHYQLGRILEARGDATGAVRALEKELALYPASFRAHFAIAKLLGEVGRGEESMIHYQRAIEVNPEFALGHLFLANAYLERGKLDEALRHATRGLELGPQPASFVPFGHFILADVYGRLGQPREAARQMELGRRLQGS